MEGLRMQRIFEVLESLSANGAQTVTEISKSLSLPMSSTHDLLQAMYKTGIASKTVNGYVIGPRAARLSFAIQNQFSVVNVAKPELEKLVEQCGFDVYLALRTGTQVMYASRFKGRQRVNIDIPLGRPLYRHATATGKLFAAMDREIYQALVESPKVQLTPKTATNMAEIDRSLAVIRKQKMSVSYEEAVQGVIGIASPILNSQGVIIGAVHISAFIGALDERFLDNVCDQIAETSKSIENELEHAIPIEVS